MHFCNCQARNLQTHSNERINNLAIGLCYVSSRFYEEHATLHQNMSAHHQHIWKAERTNSFNNTYAELETWIRRDARKKKSKAFAGAQTCSHSNRHNKPHMQQCIQNMYCIVAPYQHIQLSTKTLPHLNRSPSVPLEYSNKFSPLNIYPYVFPKRRQTT